MKRNRTLTALLPPMAWRRPARCTLLAAAALLAALWPHSPASANSATTHSLSVDQILVANDGEGYASVAPFRWNADITVDAGSLGRVRSWLYWVILAVEGQVELDLKPFAASASYSIGDRPKRFRGQVGRVVSETASASGWFSVENWARLACSRQASAWRDRGWSDEQIFGREHRIAVRYRDRYDVEFTADNYLDLIVEGSPPRFTEIVCGRAPATLEKRPPVAPPPPTNDLAVPFSISRAEIEVQPSHATGPCPMTLDVTASLTAVGKGTASFRLIHNGAPGPVRKVTFKKGGEKTDSATFTVGASSAGLGFESAGRGGGGGSRGRIKAPTTSGQHTGHFAIQVVAPNTVRSDEAFYSVICRQTAVETPTTLAVPVPKPGSDPPKAKKPARQKPDPDRTKNRKPPSKPQSKPPSKPSSEPRPEPAGSEPVKPTRGSNKPSSGAREKPATAAQPPARPDLEILRAGSRAGALSLLVHNAGTVGAPKSTLAVRCAMDGMAHSWKAAVPALPGNGRKLIQTQPPASARPVQSKQRDGCSFAVDPGNAIAEANERNNHLFCGECSLDQGKARR